MPQSRIRPAWRHEPVRTGRPAAPAPDWMPAWSSPDRTARRLCQVLALNMMRPVWLLGHAATPTCVISFSMVRMSRTRGMRWSVIGSSVRTHAARIGSAAFFEPLTQISPSSAGAAFNQEFFHSSAFPTLPPAALRAVASFVPGNVHASPSQSRCVHLPRRPERCGRSLDRRRRRHPERSGAHGRAASRSAAARSPSDCHTHIRA